MNLRLVYICFPYSGDIEENEQKARKYCRYAVNKGVVPIAPRLFFPRFLSEMTERETVTAMNMKLLSRCDELWVFDGAVSAGMEQEIKKAEELKMEILFVLHDDGNVNYTIRRVYDNEGKEKMSDLTKKIPKQDGD